MRWLVTLQVALGFAALFGLAYMSVDQVVGPVTQAYAGSAAEAESRSATAELSVAWRDALEAQGRVVRTLADGEVFGRMGDKGAADSLNLALEAAVAEVGGKGTAGLFNPDGTPAVERADAAPLAGTEAVQGALTGVSAARFELVGDTPNLVTASPILRDGAVAGVLAVATPVDGPRLRGWTETLPAGVAVALALDGKPLLHTLPQADFKLPGDLADRTKVGAVEYAVARRPVVGGPKVQAMGLAIVRGEGARAAVQHVQLLVLILGGLAFLVAALVFMISPSLRAPVALAEDEALTADVPAPAFEASLSPSPIPSPVAIPAPMPTPKPAEAPLSFPAAPVHAGPGPITDSTFTRQTVPSHPAPPQPVPDTSGAPFAVGSADFKTPLGGERSPFAKPAPAPAPLPSPQFSEAPPVTAFPAPPSPQFGAGPGPVSFAPSPAPAPAPPSYAPAPPSYAPPPSPAPAPAPSRGSAISFGVNAVPAPSPAPRPAPAPAPMPAAPPPSAFDAIADAARSRPPQVSVGANPSASEDLPAPKGGVPPELVARERAEAQRAAMARGAADLRTPRSSPYDPELPAPKGPDSQLRGSSDAMSPISESSRWAAAAGDASGTAIPLPGSAAASSNPWENPSVPAMPAPSAPPYSASTIPVTAPPGPADVAPYDEAHYRMVYNEFVASKARLGESVDAITYEGFRSKLRSSEEQLLGRHGCRAVRFQVLVKDRTVSLRPQLVR
ncbi:MAG: hypothetical protein H6730_00330 [Deltaproteobacteria bacterium]|nr:hypothetical protein [Deltaproteobacteria bacterium]